MAGSFDSLSPMRSGRAVILVFKSASPVPDTDTQVTFYALLLSGYRDGSAGGLKERRTRALR